MTAKLFGSLLLVGAGLYIALLLARYEHRRVGVLDGYLSLLRFIRGQIDCFSMPIGQILATVDPSVLAACRGQDRASAERPAASLPLLLHESRGYLGAESERLLTCFAAQWGLVILAGVCMTASAYFGIESLTIVSYIAVPSVAILGTIAMVMAVMRGDGTIIDQFAKSSGSLTIIGGAGLVIGSFVSGGTATPNFARFAKDGKAGAITTVVAFFIGNSLMFFFGAVSSIFVGGNDIFEVMVRLNLFYLAVLVLGLNIWTTNDNALYTAGLGLANIFHQRKKPMVLLSGIIGTVASVWLYYNFCGWLNILNCTLPPVGMILVLAYFMNKKDFETDQPKLKTVDWFAVAGVILGAIVANLLHWGIASINGMVVAAVCYCVGQAVNKRK